MLGATPLATLPLGDIPDGAPASIEGTLSATLGALTLAATGKLAITATEATTLGAATLAATGRLAITGSLGATLGGLALAGSGTLALAGATTAQLGDVTLAAAGEVEGASTETPGPGGLERDMRHRRNMAFKRRNDAAEELERRLGLVPTPETPDVAPVPVAPATPRGPDLSPLVELPSAYLTGAEIAAHVRRRAEQERDYDTAAWLLLAA